MIEGRMVELEHVERLPVAREARDERVRCARIRVHRAGGRH
jgi:hypothetical protein